MKITNQGRVLNTHTQAECGCMEAWSKEVRSGDTMNLEARAAAYYWKNYYQFLP